MRVLSIDLNQGTAEHAVLNDQDIADIQRWRGDILPTRGGMLLVLKLASGELYFFESFPSEANEKTAELLN